MRARTVPLGDLVTFRGGGTPDRGNPTYWGAGIPWASVKDLVGLELGHTQESVTAEGLEHSAANLIPAGSVVIATRMAVGRAAMTSQPMAINQDLKALLCGPDVVPRFLLHYLRAREPQIQAMSGGATVKGVTIERLATLPVILPSRDEQRRIATILDKADDVRRKRQASRSLAATLPATLFAQFFSEWMLSTSPPDLVRLEAVAQIVSGVTKGRCLPQGTNAVPYLRVANVQDGRLALADVREIEATTDEIERFRLQPGDIVLTEGGDPDKLGRGAVWRGQLGLCIHQNHVFRVRVSDDRFTPEYLSALLGSPYGKQYFRRAAKQTTGIASINRTQLGAFPVIVVPRAAQERYSAAVLAWAELEHRLAGAQAEANLLITSLSRSLLKSDQAPSLRSG